MPMPPVSMRSKFQPSRRARWMIRSRVVPGVGSTMATGLPIRRLKRLGLPTLGRPGGGGRGLGGGGGGGGGGAVRDDSVGSLTSHRSLATSHLDNQGTTGVGSGG